MRIENLRSEEKNGRARVAATVIWENCDRPVEELYFETDEAFADDLTCSPEAFLLARAMAAMHYGEKRVFVDAEVCPELKSGLVTAMGYIHHWFPRGDMPVIETRVRKFIPGRQRPERAGFFFSGGVDSFATLRANRLDYPEDQPLYLRDGIVAHGLEMSSPEAFGHVVDTVSKAAAETGLTLIPVNTNVYLPFREEDEPAGFIFWEEEFMGAALASVAHAFSNRLSTVSISGTFSISIPVPFATHPLVDPNFSSTDLRIRHEGFLLTRLDKVRLLADWEPALRYMRVCNKFGSYREGVVNCCHCEKCVRTMLELMVLGALEKADAFNEKEITAELLMETVKLNGNYTQLSYRELMEPLSAMGREDLVRVIRKKIAAYRKENWIGSLRQFDGEHLHGSLARIKRIVGQVLS